MCRTTDFPVFPSRQDHKTVTNIKAFYIRFSGFNSSATRFPDSLSLFYLPRGNHDSPISVTLHKVINVQTQRGEAIYGSKDRVRTKEGASFWILVGEVKILEGSFRKDEEMLKLQSGDAVFGGSSDVARAEVCMAFDDDAALVQRVEMVQRRKRGRKSRGFGGTLQAIPEDTEEVDDGLDVGGGCGCDCSVSGSDGGDSREGLCGPDCLRNMEEELEGVRWAVDVGLWVMCLGVGFLVSKASARSLRRLRIL